MNREISIWVGDLGAHNEGVLVGGWIELPMNQEDLRAEIKNLTNGADEYAVFDTDSEILPTINDPLSINIRAINAYAELVSEISDRDVEILKPLFEEHRIDNIYDAVAVVRNIDQLTILSYDPASDPFNFYELTRRDVTTWFLERWGDANDVPDSVFPYIDFKAFVNDSDGFFTPGRQHYVDDSVIQTDYDFKDLLDQIDEIVEGIY